MIEIKCKSKGCNAFFRTEESVSPDVTYTCRKCTPRAPKGVYFQEAQFEYKSVLNDSVNPAGTAHIPFSNQNLRVSIRKVSENEDV